MLAYLDQCIGECVFDARGSVCTDIAHMTHSAGRAVTSLVWKGGRSLMQYSLRNCVAGFMVSQCFFFFF